MKKHLLALLFVLSLAIPSFAQRMPVATTMDANGRMLYVDFRESELTTPDPQHVSIQKATIFDFQCVPTPTNPPAGNDRFYCDSGTGQMACLTSTGASCVGAGTGSVSSVGLAGPTGIPISNSPCTSSCTLTWAMPAGWVLGDMLVGNGPNSVARLPAPTTPDQVPELFISTPNSGATQPQWALAGLPGRVVSTTTDTIVAADRTPQTIEYTNNNPTAITVPDPASTGFNGNPAFITIAEGLGPYTFTPQTSAVITYCDGSNCFSGQPNIVLQKGEYASWSSPTTSNWLVRKGSTQPIANPPVVNGLISGGGVTWTGLLTFTCSAAQYAIGGTVYNSPQTNLTLAAADPTNPRIDVIAVNSSGACVAITGTPAGSPAAPSVDPTSQLSLTFVTIAANATTPTLNSILVYDENSTPPTEYTCTPTANFNCNSTNNPFHLTHDIEATTAVATNSVTLVNSGTVNFSTYSTLSFNIRNKASWPAAKSLQICFLNSTTVVGNCIAFKNGVFGFNQANITGYQQIVIPLSQFALGSTVADRVRFQVIGGGGSIGFYLDWIQIQSTLSGSGSSSFQLQVNGQNTQPTTNLADNGSVTWSCTVTPGTTVSVCKATAVGAPPSGTAGGDLSGTYPNPSVNQVEGAAIPTSAHVIGTNGSKQLVTATQTDVSAIRYAAGGGSANAQTLTLSPAITGYTNGLNVCWLPIANNSTTTPTLAVNGLTAITIVKAGGAALVAGDLTTTAIACVIYDGTNFELGTPQTAGSGVISLTGDSFLFSNSASTGAVTLTPRSAATGTVFGVSPIAAAGKIVQHTSHATAGASDAKAFSSNNTAGNLLLDFVWVNGGGAVAPTDTAGNTWQLAGNVSGGSYSLYYVCSAIGGANTVTSAKGGSTAITQTLIEVTGNVNTGGVTNCFDVIGGATGTSTIASASTTNPLTTTDIILFGAAVTGGGPTFTAGFGFTTLDVANTGGIAQNDFFGNNFFSSGIVTGTSSLSTSQAWRTIIAAFKMTASGVSTTPSFINLASSQLPFTPNFLYTSDSLGQTSAITDTPMFTVGATSSMFRFTGIIDCTTSSAAATATLNLKWTDDSNTAETSTAVATCTTLGSNSSASLVQAIRAKNATSITIGVTISSTPTYDISVRLEQM